MTAFVAVYGHDPGRVRELARDLLSESPFVEHRPSMTDRVLERIGAVLGELLGRFLELVSGDTAVAWVIVVVGGLLLVLAVWRWTRGTNLAPGVDAPVPQLHGRSWRDWLAASEQAAAAGAHETALRQRYLAVVARLVQDGVVDEVPGRTIRELDNVLGTAWPQVADAVAEVGRRLERVVYAGATAGPDDLRVADEAVQAVTGSRRGAAARGDEQRVGA